MPPRHTTDTVVVFPFHIPIPLSASARHGILSLLSAIRILKPRPQLQKEALSSGAGPESHPKPKHLPLKFPVNFATAPVIAVIFLLACTAIHRREVHDGILGSDGCVIPIINSATNTSHAES